MDLDAPLTTRQAVVIASRALCVYLLLEALVNLTYFPGYIAGLSNAMQQSHRALTDGGYFIGYYVRYMAVATIRLAVEVFFALWFYRADAGPMRFLLKDKSESATSS